MAKQTKPKTKTTAGKAAATKASRTPTPAKTSRPAPRTGSTSKYDQPGAPWWKKIPAPLPR